MMRRISRCLLLVLASSTLIVNVADAGPEDGTPLRYRIEGAPVADGCGRRIVLAARNLTFLSGNRLYADVVHRVYALERRGPRLVATGRFDSDYACSGTRIEESWDLTQQPDGSLVGALTSTWRLSPECEPCTVLFRIRAVPVRP